MEQSWDGCAGSVRFCTAALLLLISALDLRADQIESSGDEAVAESMASLREEGALEYRSGRITILDRDRMLRIAQFDPAYLHQLG